MGPTKMQPQYIPEFADCMSTGHHATTFDLFSQLLAINKATTTHIASLQSGTDPIYPSDHPDFFPLAAVLFRVNADSYHLLMKIEVEIRRYCENMQLLFQEFTAKFFSLYYKHGSHIKVQGRLGDDLIGSLVNLSEFVEGMDMGPQVARKGYLFDGDIQVLETVCDGGRVDTP